MNLNTVDENNQHEVDLAFKTLEFIEQLGDDEIPTEVLPKMRDVIANISDFQFRFAAPMDLPVGFGRPQDMSRFLPTPKPLNVLLKHKFAYLIDDNRNSMRQDDGVIVDGKVYCFAGLPTWKSLVDAGKLTGNDATSPNLKSADWMKDLFTILKHAKAEHKHMARRLAACWYHIATQIDYEASPEDEDENEAAATMQEAGMSFLSMLGGGQAMMLGEEDEEDDEDFDPEAEDEGEEDEEEDEEDAEINDAEDEEGEGEHVAEKEKEEKSNREEKEEKEEKEKKSNEDDAEGDEEEEEFDEEDEDVEFSERELSPEEQAYRKAILESVESLNAYMPSPSEDVAWFKRALKAMSMAPMMGLTDWYPFGIPPLEPLKKCAESADEQEKQYAKTILQIYERLG